MVCVLPSAYDYIGHHTQSKPTRDMTQHGSPASRAKKSSWQARKEPRDACSRSATLRIQRQGPFEVKYPDMDDSKDRLDEEERIGCAR